jgi:pimeloyl-ACP methyl ester carboxylesterase
MDLVVAAAGLVAGAAAGVAFSFRKRNVKGAACVQSDSRVVETALGPIECGILGQGPAVLVIHGCPGGYDQGLIAARLASDKEFRFISPSRPGYLRTPLGLGETPEAQADVYAALLDELSIPEAVVIGISGGGPSALQFALRYPKRCRGLVTVCAISRRLSQAEIAKCKSPSRRIVLAGRMALEFAWNLTLLAASRIRDSLPFEVLKDPDHKTKESKREETLDFTLGLLRSFGMSSMRKGGLQNDMRQLTTMPIYPLERIKAPTLILHGRKDDLVPFSHAEFIADTVPDSKLLDVEGGGHLFLATHKPRVVPAVIEFLRKTGRKSVLDSRAMTATAAGQRLSA